MPSNHIKKNDVSSNSSSSQSAASQPGLNQRPPSTNGYTLSTEQLHQLLSGDQQSTCHDPFEEAVHKQQQLLSICNLLDRQNSIHNRLDQLLNAENGAHVLDQKISEFKFRCPADILRQLSHPSSHQSIDIKHGDIINMNFFSQINERLYSPLLTLSKLNCNHLSNEERQDWYDWCADFDSRLASIEEHMGSCWQFFSMKTFDKVLQMTKDKAIQQQIGCMKNLFQSSDLVEHDVEYS